MMTSDRLDSYLDQQDEDAQEYLNWLYRWLDHDSPDVYCACGNRLELIDLEIGENVCRECR